MKLDVPESMPVCAEDSKWFSILSPRGLCDMSQGRAQPQGRAVGGVCSYGRCWQSQLISLPTEEIMLTGLISEAILTAPSTASSLEHYPKDNHTCVAAT